MAPRNASELARLEVELEVLKGNLFHRYNSKSTKEYLLRQIHDIERQLGIKLTQYNGGSNK